jgi:hypothetical protein
LSKVLVLHSPQTGHVPFDWHVERRVGKDHLDLLITEQPVLARRVERIRTVDAMITQEPQIT